MRWRLIENMVTKGGEREIKVCQDLEQEHLKASAETTFAISFLGDVRVCSLVNT